MVIEALNQFNWKDKEILVSCSGGLDSMVLLHGLLHLGLKPHVFHVNYGLRGEESDADEELVRNVCKKYGLELHLQKADPDLLKAQGVNLQNEARKIRRNFFSDWLAGGEDRVVALGHHADDQEETFFLRLLRGAGTVGLGAMHASKGNICRPFLYVRKQELHAWALKNNVPWREDRSNDSVVYARNRLRNYVLPRLHQEIPDLNASVLLLTGYFRSEVQHIGKRLQLLANGWQEKREIAVGEWLNFTREEKEVFLYLIAVDTGQVEAFDQLAGNTRGKELRAGGRIFFRSRHTIKEVTGRACEHRLEIRKANCLPEKYDPEILYLDADLVCGELELRPWTKGDFIEPIGVKGRQSVVKVLKDAGIAQQERDSVWIVSDAKNILWIPGVKVSRHSLATGTSRNILEVKHLCL